MLSLNAFFSVFENLLLADLIGIVIILAIGLEMIRRWAAVEYSYEILSILLCVVSNNLNFVSGISVNSVSTFILFNMFVFCLKTTVGFSDRAAVH